MFLVRYVFFSFFSVSAFYTNVAAQTGAETLLPENIQITDSEDSTDHYQKIADMLFSHVGISLNSNLKEIFIKQLKNGNTQKAIKPSSDKVIKHIRFDNEFTFLNKNDKEKVYPPTTSKNLFFFQPQDPEYKGKTRTKNKKIDIAQQVQKQTSKLFLPEEKAACSRSSTKRFKMKSHHLLELQKHNQNPEEINYLYLTKDMYQRLSKRIDNDELFGRNINIFEYSTNIGDFASLAASRSNIKCLPFRIIMKKNMLYEHYGINALKNFENSLSGELDFRLKEEFGDEL